MAHKTHRWQVRSLQQLMDLQHIEITWQCVIRGCHRMVTYTHVFRRPPGTLGSRRSRSELGGLVVDWRNY